MASVALVVAWLPSARCPGIARESVADRLRVGDSRRGYGKIANEQLHLGTVVVAHIRKGDINLGVYMTTRSNSSRERILSTAESIILQRGYAGTTIEDILHKASITKGGFFYHFDGKTDLARALVERYIEMDSRVFQGLSDRADSLSEDPLQRTLLFLNLFAEMVAGMTDVHPGCLVASFTYETQQFDDEIRNLMERGMLEWRGMIAGRLNQIIARYPPRIDVSVDALADMFSSTLEGGIILARIYGDNRALIDQVQSYRNHLRLVFGDV